MSTGWQLNVRGVASSPYCDGCPCSKNGQAYKAVRAFGSPGGLCIVGEGPGQNELLQGYPFVGESGKVVNKALKQAGVDRALTWITNATLCKRPSSEEDLYVAMEHCRERLRQDLELGRPTAIVALGGTAMRALQLEVFYVAQARGTVQYSPLAPGVPVIGSIHPAALLRGGAGEMVGGGKQKMNVDAQAMFLYSDVEKAARIAEGALSPVWSDDILVVHEASEASAAVEAILQDIYEDGILGLDLEWVCRDSKDPLDALGAGGHRAQITFVGVGCTRRAVSFMNACLLESEALWRIQDALEDELLVKVIHNKQADRAVWEAQVGPIAGRVIDTMLMHHCAYPGIDHDLQQVTSQSLCVPPWKVDHAREIAEAKQQDRNEAKARKEIERARKKAERVAAHEARNAALKAEKEERRAKKAAERQLKLQGVES